ncbi:MAG TPA: GNAT family protein [Candidatus Baltobacteraceae bacterium]|jgi:ribosomal-protein-serine acetyltransferase|nr:GNAT family protein [Candidatus Baltobacteraceae bacterium]
MDRSNPARSGKPLTEPTRITAALVDFRLHIDDETEIRLLRIDDAQAVYDAITRNVEHLKPWMTWMDGLVDSVDVHAWIRNAEREAYHHTSFKAGILRKNRLIGFIDLHEIDWSNGHAGIGYWLDRAHTGLGIMTQAVRLMTEYAFDALDLHRVEIHVATQNLRSRRIPERLGFTLEGILRQVQQLRGTYVDHALYALLREDRP